MAFSLSLFIASRYTTTLRGDHFIGFISKVSMIGIALSVMVLITVLSVMNGFPKEVRQRILHVTPHLVILDRGPTLADWQQVRDTLATRPEVVGMAPFVQAQGMLTASGDVRGVMIQGVDPRTIDKVFPLSASLKQGRLKNLAPEGWGIILGSGIASSLNLKLGDKVTLVLPEVSVSIAGVQPRVKRFTVVGVFHVNYMHDNNYVFIHQHDAQIFARLGGDVSGLEVALSDPFEAPRLAKVIRTVLGSKRVVVDWTQQNSAYFDAVRMEKTMMFIILLLIVAMAIFNVVSTLVMVVTDKKADIAILKTLGATPRIIRRIFLWQGCIIGLIGTLAGVGLGVALSLTISSIIAWLERVIGVQFLSSEMYYINFLPSDLQWMDVMMVGGLSFGLSLLATWYPAHRAAKLLPAEGLRHGL